MKTIFVAFAILTFLENPMADIQQLDKVHTELWDGKIYSTEELYGVDSPAIDENRNVIERIISRVTDGENGKGKSLDGKFDIGYEDGKFQTGDFVISYCLYDSDADWGELILDDDAVIDKVDYKIG